MRHLPSILVLTVVSGLSAAPAWAADPITAQDRDRLQDMDMDMDQDREQDRLHQEDLEQLQTQLRKKVKVSDGDLTLIEPALKRYLRLNGEPEHLRATIQAGMDNGCTGACMQEMVRATNRAMVWGMQDVEANRVVTECLQDRVRDRDRTGATWSDDDFANQLHDRVRDRLRVWERDRDQLRERERERELERSRTREMERQTERQTERAGTARGRGNQ